MFLSKMGIAVLWSRGGGEKESKEKIKLKKRKQKRKNREGKENPRKKAWNSFLLCRTGLEKFIHKHVTMRSIRVTSHLTYRKTRLWTAGTCLDLGLLLLIPGSNKGLSASSKRSCTLHIYPYLTRHTVLSTLQFLKKCVGYNNKTPCY